MWFRILSGLTILMAAATPAFFFCRPRRRSPVRVLGSTGAMRRWINTPGASNWSQSSVRSFWVSRRCIPALPLSLVRMGCRSSRL
ncbi:MAG: hypothetical protein BYD32DRAFT_416089 [Podila humilis]|nr:MAG: hypothetical protein BYD32DRAFT_416089 [Podila humilis]